MTIQTFIILRQEFNSSVSDIASADSNGKPAQKVFDERLLSRFGEGRTQLDRQ